MARDTTPDGPSDGAVVLVVDDDPDLRALVDATLTGAGWTVHTAESGTEALAASERIAPDLVISDVMMPGLDGWALVRALRSRPTTALTPVILMTALNGREDRLRGFRLGADDYLPKPFEPTELVLRVRRVLASTPELSSQQEADLTGRLDQIGLSSVLTMLDNERKSGTLTLRSGDADCRIELREGSVCTAAVDGGPSDEEAVYHALQWSSGDFCFHEHTVETVSLGVQTMGLLLEAARRFDESSGDALLAWTE